MPALLRSFALVALLLSAARAEAASIVGTYQAQGVVVEVGAVPDYVQWTSGMSVGAAAAVSFSLQDVPESAPGVYDYAPMTWSVVAAPRFDYLGGPSAGAGSVELWGNLFDLHVPDGLLTFGGSTAYGIQFDFSAIGLPGGSGLRLPTSAAAWEAVVRDPNGNVLLRAQSVSEPSANLALGISALVVSSAGRRRRVACRAPREQPREGP